ncbi:unnamed protein product [Peronospora destructor]|uniref:Aromatic amino acid beta-eliminating lyase/threonine aldolase domain-containing protein n=1 Tax=Peronospora destructor TaxID=86335 RepID=A0AAV0VAX7_9STRA|nr:unnamed protein product [Peronospora destructor]
MRQVIASAEVGDDAFGADPSVKPLEKVAAERLGKQVALYVPSGTMSNLIAIGVHCRRGDEAICGNQAHIFLYEGGGANAYMGTENRVRAVTNLHISSHDVDYAVSSIRALLS